VDVSRIQPARKGGYRAELGIAESTVVALFSGTLGGKQGLMVIPAAGRHRIRRMRRRSDETIGTKLERRAYLLNIIMHQDERYRAGG
jgi:hypothetical protein